MRLKDVPEFITYDCQIEEHHKCYAHRGSFPFWLSDNAVDDEEEDYEIFLCPCECHSDWEKWDVAVSVQLRPSVAEMIQAKLKAHAPTWRKLAEH